MPEMSAQRSAAFPHHLLGGLGLSAFDELCRSTEEQRDYKLKHGDLELWMGRAWEAGSSSLSKNPREAGLKRGDQSLSRFMEGRGATLHGTVLVFAPLG